MDVGVSVHPNNAYWADGCGVTVDRANGETEDGKQFWQPNRIKSKPILFSFKRNNIL